METTTTMEQTSSTTTEKGFCVEVPSNTMSACIAIGCILSLIIMLRYTDKRGFWWGVGFWMLGGFAGNAIGRLIEPPVEKCF